MRVSLCLDSKSAKFAPNVAVKQSVLLDAGT